MYLAGVGGYFRQANLGAVDNENPRTQAALLEGAGARAYAAQANAWEAVALFSSWAGARAFHRYCRSSRDCFDRFCDRPNPARNFLHQRCCDAALGEFFRCGRSVDLVNCHCGFGIAWIRS